MHHRKLKLGIATASAVSMSLGIAALPASADYAPVAKDVVGVGSDTLQYIGDFVADGDFLGDTGYNALGNKFKVVNFDATPDANARQAYGSDGTTSTPGTAQCAPGTGDQKQGTGNQTTTNGPNNVCTLNPTIVLRAGTSPVQRPNGSGDGASAISTDTHHYISYSRASSTQGGKLTAGNQGAFDRLALGTDHLKMLAASTTNAVPLSVDQLKAIYSCTTSPTDGTPGLEWKDVGGSSSDKIIPLAPQPGSGTFKSFSTDIGLSTFGTCTINTEENDPTAIAATATPADAISPVSSGRMNLFLGKLGDGSSNGVGGYFHDPSCKLNQIAAGSPAACAAGSNTLAPAVAYTTGTPATGSANFNPNSQGIYDDPRTMYIYFRDSDVNSATKWQPGSTLNWVRTLFYNPCPDNPPVAGDGCTNDPVAGEVGPGGPPYYATSFAQTLIKAAGFVPTYAVVTNITASQ